MPAAIPGTYRWHTFREAQDWIFTPPPSMLPPPPIWPFPLSLPPSSEHTLTNIDKQRLNTQLRHFKKSSVKWFNVKILHKLQTPLDFLSEIAGQCWPRCKSGLQRLAVYADKLIKKSAWAVFLSTPCTRGLPSSLLLQVEATNYQSLSCFGSKQQSPRNKMQTLVHVLY